MGGPTVSALVSSVAVYPSGRLMACRCAMASVKSKNANPKKRDSVLFIMIAPDYSPRSPRHRATHNDLCQDCRGKDLGNCVELFSKFASKSGGAKTSVYLRPQSVAHRSPARQLS